MNKTFKKVVCTVLVICMALSVSLALTSCGDSGEGQYTYKSYTTALGTNWNPHTWETNADDSILSYLSSPFVTMEALDTEKGTYQWVYEMATSIKDVTATHQSDLTKYAVSLGGAKAEDVTEGYVFEIKLNPDAKWENGVAITADDYIYSMQQLLNSKMRNYRANLYYAGESAVAGGQAYYDSEAPIYAVVVPAYDSEADADYSFDLSANKVYINLTSTDMTLASYSFATIKDTYGYIRDVKDDDGNITVPGATYYTELSKEENSYGYIEVTEANKTKVLTIMDQYLSAFGMSIYADDGETVDDGLYKEFLFYNTGKFGDKVSYDKVGCYKVDNYTINYVCQTAIDYNYFLTSCTSTWLVYKDLYEAGKDTTGELVTTNYGTSPKTTMSYGIFKFDSYQADKQIVFVQNENWYGWQKDENGDLKRDDEGNLISYTSYHKNTNGETFKVDGKDLRQYTLTKIVIDVMDEAAAKQAFMKGELSDWSPNAEELVTFAASDRLYKVDETYTMSFFFNTNVTDLKKMDSETNNKNSVVLSNVDFRKAFSLAIDRAEYVTATEGYKPTYALMNNLYYYDFYNNPDSRYRDTEQAMQAVCNLYGIKYGEGTPYADVKEAYKSVTGYNLTEAKALMKKACEALVAEGLYTAGEEIKISIAWAKGAIQSADQKQVALMNKFINAAIEGSGFGKVTFEAVGNLPDRYSDVANANYAIGYGAWGGAALYPFRNFQVYFDPSQYDINEAACWNPTTETLTLTIGGEEVTMTWQEWGNSMIGTGKYANADFETKLTITSTLETKFLEKYYRIPLAGTTACSMLSYQLNYYTEEYNMAYGFGGTRLMTFNYDDAEWAAFVKEQGGTLSYE